MVQSHSLDVIVVGGGIGGLSVAVALRREGHRVKIFERSDLNNELGAAIHLCPNASRILLRWGMDPIRARLVNSRTTTLLNGQTLDVVMHQNWSSIESTYGAPWYFAHRVDLHTELKRLATEPNEIRGPPATLIPGAKVVSYDPQLGSVTLKDSTTHSADLVVAADGVHSEAPRVIHGAANLALRTNQSALRFLISTNEILEDPETAQLLEDNDGSFKLFLGENGKRLVWYPCRNNLEQNFVGLYYDDEENVKEDWNVAATHEELIDQFGGLHSSVIKVLKKAKNVTKWPLLFRSPLPTWYSDKLVLVGDAAHPMLPHQGQAGAQAVEDSVALGVVLSGLTKTDLGNDPALLSQRLEIFQQVRRNRASAIQILSNSGQDRQGPSIAEDVKPYLDAGVKAPGNPAEFAVYNFSHDVLEVSLKALEASRKNRSDKREENESASCSL